MIREEIIERADDYLEKISEKDLEKYMKQVSSDQQAMVNYVNTMADVFEDEEEYYNKFIYFYLLIHRSYTNRFRFFPTISNNIIDKVEETDQKLFDSLMEKGEENFDKEFENLLKKHPQKMLIDFITMDLYENDIEQYDDNSLDLDNQIFFLLYTVINIYEESLVESQKDIK